MDEISLSRNSLAFIALANEYCEVVENVEQIEKEDLQAKMLKLLPRLYMAATDVEIKDFEPEYYIESVLDEVVYDLVRSNLARLMAEDDIYLEVFVEDMKYSDTPISASISENLADLYQEFYNFVSTVRNVPAEVANEIVMQCKENFASYWGQILCNVLRAINSVFYNIDKDNL